jgi:hypothetical protein
MGNDGETLEVKVPDGSSTIFIQLIDRLGEVDSESRFEEHLTRCIERFYELGVVAALKKRPNYSLETARSGSHVFQQMVVSVDPQRWWLVRTGGARKMGDVYLLHWVGQETWIGLVHAILESFRIDG